MTGISSTSQTAGSPVIALPGNTVLSHKPGERARDRVSDEAKKIVDNAIPERVRKGDTDGRSDLAGGLLAAAIGVQTAKGWLIDRGRIAVRTSQTARDAIALSQYPSQIKTTAKVLGAAGMVAGAGLLAWGGYSLYKGIKGEKTPTELTIPIRIGTGAAIGGTALLGAGASLIKQGKTLAGAAGAAAGAAVLGFGIVDLIRDANNPDSHSKVARVRIPAGAFAIGAGAALLAAGRFGPRLLNANRAGTINMPQLKSLAVDLVRGPTTSSMPVDRGVWKLFHNASNGIASATGGVTLAAGVANGYSAIEEHGVKGLLTTTHGRTGVFLTLTGLLTLGVGTRSAFSHRDPGMSRSQAFIGSSWLASPKVRGVLTATHMGLGLPFMINEGINLYKNAEER